MIMVGANDQLYGLDAKTGKPVPTFGENGVISLRKGVADDYPDSYYSMSSPPAIFRNLVIMGPAIQEFGREGPSGDPRAFDLRTGKEVWRFHTVPRPGDPAADTWGPKGAENRAGPSAWGLITIDESTGTVFLPIGNPTDSYNGVDRPGDNLYSNSIVALDAATGKLKWYYQTTHHDLNDYDLSAAPALIDVVQNGRKIPAVAQATKMGLLFILDRATGKPIYGVVEKPIPQSTVPGEKSSPTQPFPVKPPQLARMSMTKAEITTMSPEATAACTAAWERNEMKSSVPYEPASVYGHIPFVPGSGGGSNWGGVSYNPQLGLIFVNVTNEVVMSRMVPDGTGGYKLDGAYTRFNDPKGYPCVEPPWGEFYAINANTGDIVWRKPLGVADEYGEPGKTTGTPNTGGSLATASGLTFIGATRDSRFRAFDSKTGAEIWTQRLPAPAQASPMTFVGKSGRQFVVVAARNSMIAFALPNPAYPSVDLPAAEAPAPRPAARDTEQGPSYLQSAPRRVAPAGQPTAPQPAAPARPPAIRSVNDLPAGPGKQVFQTMCSSCHGLGAPMALRQNRQAWSVLIEDMRGRGAPGDDQQAAMLADYLAANLGPAN
jgi:quinoprotein glucose dehydrogenase